MTNVEWLRKAGPMMRCILATSFDAVSGEGGKFPRVSADDDVQAFYVAMRLDGTGHALAEMLALQRPPMSNTDREFLEGHANGNQFERTPHVGDLYRREALEAGVDPKGKVYLGGLARFPGDPEAWVSGRGDVRRVVESRGWGCEGSVSCKARPTGAVAEPVAVAEDIVRERVADRMASVPAGEKVDVEAVREQVVNQIKPHWSR